MYNAHWIHSLPYSKFIELTLFKYFTANIRYLPESHQYVPHFIVKTALNRTQKAQKDTDGHRFFLLCILVLSVL